MAGKKRTKQPARSLRSVVSTLAKLHGEPEPHETDPLRLILLENVAYLKEDDERRLAFGALEARVGLRPEQILAAPGETLLAVARLGGMRPEERAERLREVAGIVVEELGGDLDGALGTSLSAAKKVLRRFPGIGEPGSEKILLFSGRFPVLALESNGLRVLLRLGFGKEGKSYSSSYRSVQKAVGRVDEIPFLVRAHLVLRAHGKEICKTSAPRCEACPLRASCAFAAKG